MLTETTNRAAQLSDVFKNENTKQSKEFDYLELQGNSLTDDHEKMKEISQELSGRTNEMEKRVGV
jgi:hypothetical protein